MKGLYVQMAMNAQLNQDNAILLFSYRALYDLIKQDEILEKIKELESELEQVD